MTVFFFSEEAEQKYGQDKIKVYKSTFSNMYHALTHRKTSTMMKLVCLLPEEKVRRELKLTMVWHSFKQK